MAFRCPECGCEEFYVEFREVTYGTAMVNSERDVFDTFDEWCDKFEHTSSYRCAECEHIVDDISEKSAEDVWLEKKEREYLKDPNSCPICKSGNISADHVEIDGSLAWQKVYCNECDSEWYDDYRLERVSIEGYPTDKMLDELYPGGPKPDPNKAFKEDKE
jgi:hypothetical protein